jgi:hypothetical protein
MRPDRPMLSAVFFRDGHNKVEHDPDKQPSSEVSSCVQYRGKSVLSPIYEICTGGMLHNACYSTTTLPVSGYVPEDAMRAVLKISMEKGHELNILCRKMVKAEGFARLKPPA